MTAFTPEQRAAAIDRVLKRVENPDMCAGPDTKALAAEVRRLREAVEGVEGVRDELMGQNRELTADWARLRDAIVEALRLGEGGYPHHEVLSAALRGKP